METPNRKNRKALSGQIRPVSLNVLKNKQALLTFHIVGSDDEEGLLAYIDGKVVWFGINGCYQIQSGMHTCVKELDDIQLTVSLSAISFHPKEDSMYEMDIRVMSASELSKIRELIQGSEGGASALEWARANSRTLILLALATALGLATCNWAFGAEPNQMQEQR